MQLLFAVRYPPLSLILAQKLVNARVSQANPQCPNLSCLQWHGRYPCSCYF
jgi:hypothetical protein